MDLWNPKNRIGGRSRISINFARSDTVASGYYNV